MGFVVLHMGIREREFGTQKITHTDVVCMGLFLIIFPCVFDCKLAYFWHTNGFLGKAKVP
jgi:hypothetical protein